MTLENKAGLAVACTFAALAGAAVWLMQHPEASWGSPTPTASSEQEEVIPRTTREPDASRPKGKSDDPKKTPPQGSAQGKNRHPFDDQDLAGATPNATPSPAGPRQEQQHQSRHDKPNPAGYTTASSTPPLGNDGKSGANDKSSWSSIDGSGGQTSSTDRGKPGKIQLTSGTTPMPPSGSGTDSSAAGKNDKKKDGKKEKDKGQENPFLPGSQPPDISTSGSSVTDTAKGKDQKNQAGKGSDGKDGVKDEPFPPFTPPGSTPSASGKPQASSPKETRPTANVGFPLDADSTSSLDGKPSSPPKTGTRTNPPSSPSGRSDNKSSVLPGMGKDPEKPAPMFGADDTPAPTSTGLPGSSPSGAGEQPLYSGSAPIPVQGGRKPSPPGTGLPPTGSGSGLSGRGSQPPSGPSTPPPPPAGMDGSIGVGPLQSSSPGATASHPAPMGLDNKPPASAPGTGGINIGGPSSARPAPATGTPGPAAPHAVGSAEDSIFIPDPSPSGPPAARSTMAPSPASRLIPANPTTQPGAAGSAPTIIASPGSLPPRPVPPIRSEVTSIKVWDYFVKGGDDPVSLSKRFYKTPDYAQALQKYLQNDTRFSQSVGANGQLTPGAHVQVPQDPRQLPGVGGDVMMPAVAPVATTPSPAPPPPSPFGR